MIVLNSIEKLLYEHKPVGIYNLENENSLILSELEAYASALQFIEDSAEILKKEMFFTTAETVGKERFRSLYGCNYEGSDATEYIASLMAHKEPFWNSALWQFERTRADFNITEFIVAMTVNVRDFSSFNLKKQQKIIKILRKYAPAHIALELTQQARTWDEIEGLNRSFGDIESLGLTFSEQKM